MSCRKDDCKHHVTMIHRLLLKFLFFFYKYLFRNGLHDNQSCDYFLIEFICSILKIVKLHSCIYALLSIYLLLAFSLGSCAAVSFCINNDEKMLKMQFYSVLQKYNGIISLWPYKCCQQTDENTYVERDSNDIMAQFASFRTAILTQQSSSVLYLKDFFCLHSLAFIECKFQKLSINTNVHYLDNFIFVLTYNPLKLISTSISLIPMTKLFLNNAI